MEDLNFLKACRFLRKILKGLKRFQFSEPGTLPQNKTEISVLDFFILLQFSTDIAMTRLALSQSVYKGNSIGIEIILTTHRNFFLLQKFIPILCHV